MAEVEASLEKHPGLIEEVGVARGTAEARARCGSVGGNRRQVHRHRYFSVTSHGSPRTRRALIEGYDGDSLVSQDLDGAGRVVEVPNPVFVLVEVLFVKNQGEIARAQAWLPEPGIAQIRPQQPLSHGHVELP